MADDEMRDAGEARCGWCDGPMPCFCPAPPEVEAEPVEGVICGDRFGGEVA